MTILSLHTKPVLQQIISGSCFDFQKLKLIRELSKNSLPSLRYVFTNVQGKNHQYYVNCDSDEDKLKFTEEVIEKLGTLHHILVFSEKKETAQDLTEHFKQEGRPDAECSDKVVFGRGSNLLFCGASRYFSFAYCGSISGTFKDSGKGVTIYFDFADSMNTYVRGLHQGRVLINLVLPHQRECLQKLELGLGIQVTEFSMEVLHKFTQ